MNDKTYTFDATITVMADDQTQEGAADHILEAALDNDLAVSLHTEGTLNVRNTLVELGRARTEIQKLKQRLCPYDHLMADWCSCGYSRPTDTSNATVPE